MRYYTKEWYERMQELYSVEDLRIIADRTYSDAEIQAFYDADMEDAIRRAYADYETPPSFEMEEELRDPRQVIIFNEQTGEVSHPASLAEAREHLAQERRRREAEFANRPPFDPAETREDFRDMYEALLQYGMQAYPRWVGETWDHRLLALRRVPESLYRRMKEDSEAGWQAFRAVEEEARAVWEQQDIPEAIRARFHFHDAGVYAVETVGRDVVLYLDDVEGETDYVKVTFSGTDRIEREEGLVLEIGVNEQGRVQSNCQYLYGELYREAGMYEVHMLLWTPQALRYLTIRCRDIRFKDVDDFPFV